MCMQQTSANILLHFYLHFFSPFPFSFPLLLSNGWIVSAFITVTKSLPLQHLKDKFWNFIFYKFIFIFGVLNVQTVEEVVMWCLWFSGLVFLHLMVQLCKDRFEYVSFD